MLVISGVGVIAFGIWSIIKAALYYLLIPAETLAKLGQFSQAEELHSLGFTSREIGAFIAGVIIFLLLLDFLLRLYIGRSAFIDGRRFRRKGPVYVILAILVSIGLIVSIISRVITLGAGEDDVLANVISAGNVSVIVDVTSLLALIEMIVAAFMVRKLRRKLGINGTEVE